MPDNIIIISKDEEIFRSLRRVFKTCCIAVRKWEDYIRDKPLSNTHPVVIFTVDRDSLFDLMWNEVRGRYKLFNPIIAVSFHLLDPTDDLRDLVFEKRFVTYQYFKIPFLLEEVLQSCKELKPLGNEQERKCNIKHFSQPQGLISKVEHELINLFGSDKKEDIKRESAIRYYSRVKEILQDLDFGNELILEVEEVIPKLENSTMSDKKCRNYKLTTESLFSKIRNEL